MALPATHVQLRAEDRNSIPVLTLLLGEGAPTFSGGLGGWEPVARPGRRPLTVWRGVGDPLRVTIPVLLDGYAANASVEDQIRALEKMGGLDAGDPEPPKLIVSGSALVHHDYERAPQNRWVLEGIEWGDAVRRSSGHRVRQAAELKLLLHTEDERLERVKSSAHPTYRWVRLHNGDTFEKIARRELGSSRYARELARLNGARSVDVRLKRDKVRIPTGKALSDLKRRARR